MDIHDLFVLGDLADKGDFRRSVLPIAQAVAVGHDNVAASRVVGVRIDGVAADTTGWVFTGNELRTDGDIFVKTDPGQNVEIGYTYGIDNPPTSLAQAALKSRCTSPSPTTAPSRTALAWCSVTCDITVTDE